MIRFLASLLFLGIVFATAACGNSPETPQPADSAVTIAEQADPPDHLAPVGQATIDRHALLMEMARAGNLSERPIGEIIQVLARELLGTPYVEHLLDQSDEEMLVVNLVGFDCVLFNEAVFSLARAVRMEQYDFDSFVANIEDVRYRDGQLRDYCSRLHYFSDWLWDNDRRGNVRLVTDELRAARAFDKRINFMTQHRNAYRILADDEQFACIADVERGMEGRRFTFVPQERLTEVYDQLQTGDMIAITTNIGGLDIAHTGFVYKSEDGRTGFIHASTTGQVRLERDLATYVQGIRRQNGIMVGRPVDPLGGR